MFSQFIELCPFFFLSDLESKLVCIIYLFNFKVNPDRKSY